MTMAATGQTGMGFPEEYGGGGDLGASIAAFETLAYGDLSVLVKVGVQFGLFGGAILQLGTQRHHDAYLRDLITGRLMGCFAMTEVGPRLQRAGARHGRDVRPGHRGARRHHDRPVGAQGLDRQRRPARRGRGGVRPARGRPASGTASTPSSYRCGATARCSTASPIEDDGLKMGLNGVDNGRISFDHVRVPRENLLNQFADVTPDGRYESPIDNANRRFFTMLGTLVQGRVCVGGAGINAAKVALAIAVRYADRRRQFNATSEEHEELLLDYGMHQRRLLPLLARTYALHFAQEVVALELHEVFSQTEAPEEGENDHRRRELESLAAGVKALGTWHATATIQECREACGGQGYRALNRFAALKADTDVFTTFEGDNHVLLQLVAKGLLTDYASEFEDMDQFGMVRFVAGLAVETVIEKTVGAQADRAGARRAARRGRLGPGGRAARPELPADDAAVPRGAHALRRRPAAQARHRPRHEPRRGLLPGAGPRDRRRPRPRRAAGASTRSSTRSRPSRTATPRSRSTCCATCSRCRRSRPTGRGSWSTAGSPASAPRRSAARSTACAARSARSPSTWSTPSAYRAEMLRSPELVGLTPSTSVRSTASA